MIVTHGVSLRYGKRILFDDVSIKFNDGNCYGVIGANGAGKSTFLKILSGDIDSTDGHIEIAPGKRMAVLRQNHFEYDEFTVKETVIQGHQELYQIMKEKDAIYMKEYFSDEDGIKASELEEKFAEMNGWEADSEAGELLNGIGILDNLHDQLMKDIPNNLKVRVLLAQALFGNPDILILDEPTNDLDVETISWLEDFLLDFKNLVIVVSHDRHFLDTVCTHIADVDFKKIKLYTGNYSFWYESSQLALKQQQQQNKKAEEKKKELQEFIARFSANVKKSKQATSRKKMLENLNIEDIQPSTRRYPGIIFSQEREAGDQVLNVENLSYEPFFKNLNFSIRKGDKVAVLSRDSLATNYFYKILNSEIEAHSGSINWGVTIKKEYLPNENNHYFSGELNLIDWLRQYSQEKDETYIRGFLGKMLFSGEDVFKMSNVLSGGEKVRCMLSKLMLSEANLMMLDEPTNHLDLESIISLNDGLKSYSGIVLLTSHDHTMIQTVANRIIEITPNGMIDKHSDYESYTIDPKLQDRRNQLYLTNV